MIKTVIRLIKPGLFLPCFEIEPPQREKVLVRPRYLSICAADQRYFTGNRPPQILAQKLPMSLIHEATGVVVADPTGTFSSGQNVILLPGGRESGAPASNYHKGAFFRSSNADGFCQETIYLAPEELIAVPDDAEYYVFAEMVSVCCHALRRIAVLGKITSGTRIGVWGDGAMGYLMALAAHELFPEAEIFIFGKHDSKLLLFSFIRNKVNILDEGYLPELDVAFECVGGQGASHAIRQIIDCLCPCGTVALMGVSELPPSINTRMILEKGLHIIGCSRSQRCDFEQAKELIDRDNVKGSLEKIISERINVASYTNLQDAFVADISNQYKTLLTVQF